MNKKYTLFLLFLYIIPFTQAYYNSQNLVINLNLSSDIEVVPTSSNYILQKLTANLSFFPLEDLGQTILSYETTPIADIQNGVAQFVWDSPEGRSFKFSTITYIRTTNVYNEIKTKVPFPISISKELVPYTQPSEKIDSDNEDIIKLASELAHGEDDLFVVTHNLGLWIEENIDYNLTTSTLEANQDASWVLENKYGVCDEITNLFIAMSRSLGIPAKFISGVAYTTSEKFAEQYGSHGWAEVYFPEYGWIPFDITYNEFGYIDPTHLKLTESIDSNEASTNYQWIGKNVDIKTRSLDIAASVIEDIGKSTPPIKLTMDVMEKAVDYNSYNLIDVIVENQAPYYISTQLTLSKPAELEIIGNTKKRILLKPNQKKSVYWKVKLSDLDSLFTYQFPLIVYSLKNQSASTTFSVSKGNIVLLSQEIDAIIEQNKEEIQKVYSGKVDLNCSLDKNQLKENEKITATCSLKNIGNILLKDINICLKEDCNSKDLGISQSVKTEFTINTSVIGRQKAAIMATNDKISKATYLEFEVLDEPKIAVIDIDFPLEVEFNQDYSISFTLSKKSFSTPKNVEIILSQKGFKQGWNLDQLVNDQRLTINLKARDLTGLENKFNIVISFGKNYKTKEEFTIKLINATFSQKMRVLLNAIAAYLVGIFM